MLFLLSPVDGDGEHHQHWAEAHRLAIFFKTPFFKSTVPSTGVEEKYNTWLMKHFEASFSPSLVILVCGFFVIVSFGLER